MKEINDTELEDESEEYTMTIGEGLEDALDDYIASFPSEVLEAVRQQDIANGDDTEIIDKAIAERKIRDKSIRKEQGKQQKLQEAEEIERKKKCRRAALFGILSGLNKSNTNSSDTDNLMPWEQELVDSGKYKPYNFEEEEMEEDDFYYEDD